jgi:hypothetical protein
VFHDQLATRPADAAVYVRRAGHEGGSMKAAFEFLLVGRTPLGSSVRGVIIAVLIMLFWALFLDRFWTLVTVSVITALAVVVAAHLFSGRDDQTRAPLRSGTPPHT